MKKTLFFALTLLWLPIAAVAQWQDDVVLIDGLQMGEVYPDEGGNAFIILEQFDNNCGPTSVEMLLYYYTKWKSLTDVWSAGDIYSVEFGAWPWELRQALNELDVPTHWYDELTPSDLRYYIRNNRPPIILLRFENGLHYVVVVGYYQGSQNWYLVADPNGWFTWYTEERLETGWSLEHPGISDSVPNAFTLEGVGAWLAAEISDLSLDSNNAIVPQYAPTRHFYNLWAEMLAVKVYGDSIPFGTTHGWHSTLDFGKSINYIQVSDIELLSSTGTATLDDYNWTQGGSTVRLEGRIEDGAILRGRMWVIVRAFRVGSAFAAPAMPSQPIPISPTETSLMPNFPNPFNPETWIPYQLAKPAQVRVSIHSVDGKLVRTLELGHLPAGVYQDRDRAAYWDGRNAQGEPVASGVYFYTFKADGFSATRKMLIRK